MSSRVYRGGVPTDIDIRKIRERFPDSSLTVGRIIKYSDVEDVIDVIKNSFRFRTVTWRWRRIVESESAIIIGTERGEGFKILNNNETFEYSNDKLRSAVRSAARSYHLYGYVERKELSKSEQKLFDFNHSKAAALIAVSQLKSIPKRLPSL